LNARWVLPKFEAHLRQTRLGERIPPAFHLDIESLLFIGHVALILSATDVSAGLFSRHNLLIMQGGFDR
jgi:hypothetical protein